MEELQVIETTSGRQFKPWASREDVQSIKQETVQAVVQAVQDPASITAITNEIAGGKQAIASAINAKGGTASATESFAELAEAVEEIPNVNNGGLTYINGYEPEKTADFSRYSEFLRSYNNPEDQNLTAYKFAGMTELENIIVGGSRVANSVNIFAGCTLDRVVIIDAITLPANFGFPIGSSVKYFSSPNCSYFNCSAGNTWRGAGLTLLEFELGVLMSMTMSGFYSQAPVLRNVIIKNGSDGNLDFSRWNATYVIAEGQSSIDELNANLYNNLLTKLYDHSNDGQTRTLRIGWLARVTAENIAYANAKGWTLTT